MRSETATDERVLVEKADEARRVRSRARIGRVVNLVFAMVYLLLGLRLLLSVLAVSPGAAFAQWVLLLTDPLLAPLGVLLPRLISPDGYPLALPVLLAMLLYGLLHFAARGLLRREGRGV